MAATGSAYAQVVLPGLGFINTVVGDGTGNCDYSGDYGAATSAELCYPGGVAVDGSGNIYIADTANNVIRDVSASTGVISTVAGDGTGYCGYSGDYGLATSVELCSPSGVAVDSSGNIYIADTGNNVIREVSGGYISTVAGNGTAGYSGDGNSATDSGTELNYPMGVAVDSDGDIEIADTGNNAIREVSGGTGVISTVAGDGTGYCGYSGDGGLATNAELCSPSGVALDVDENIYIADAGNNVIRATSVRNGRRRCQRGRTCPPPPPVVIIGTVAGNGTAGYYGDGNSATDPYTELNSPSGMAVDGNYNIYIADTANNVIREVSYSTGYISTVVGDGTGSCGYSGDGGLATDAELCYPNGVTLDNSNNIYIADTDNNVIRIVGSEPTPTLSVATSGTPSTYGGAVTFTATISSGATGTVTFNDGATAMGTGAIGGTGGTTATFPTIALAVGTHTITASYPGNAVYSGAISSPITQTVLAAVAGLVSLAITPANPTIAVGSGQQLTATGTFSDSSQQDLTASVTWSSSNVSVALIGTGSSGLAGFAMGATTGTATITATLGSTQATTLVTVQAAVVPNPPSITTVSPTDRRGRNAGDNLRFGFRDASRHRRRLARQHLRRSRQLERLPDRRHRRRHFSIGHRSSAAERIIVQRRPLHRKHRHHLNRLSVQRSTRNPGDHHRLRLRRGAGQRPSLARHRQWRGVKLERHASRRRSRNRLPLRQRSDSSKWRHEQRASLCRELPQHRHRDANFWRPGNFRHHRRNRLRIKPRQRQF